MTKRKRFSQVLIVAVKWEWEWEGKAEAEAATERQGGSRQAGKMLTKRRDSQNGQEQPPAAAASASTGRASAFGQTFLFEMGQPGQVHTGRKRIDAKEAFSARALARFGQPDSSGTQFGQPDSGGCLSHIWVGAFPISACALARFGWVPLPISASALARFGQKCPGTAILHPITTPPPPSFHGRIHLPFWIGLFYF
jgi:hypothetical protein